MDLRPWIWTTALLTSLGLGLSLDAFADDDDDDDDDEQHEEGERHEEGGRRARGQRDLAAGVAPVGDAATLQECGSCHMAYPAGLLPARSWVTLMGGLTDHFGDNAELPPEQVQAITAWLVANAADTRPDHEIAARIAASVAPDQVPLRIMDVPWLRQEHDEIPASVLAADPTLRSLSACASCHPDAAQGRFDEDAIRLPGLGRWED